MDLRKLKALVDLVSESNVSELEITEAEGKVRIVKTPPPAATPMNVPMHMHMPMMVAGGGGGAAADGAAAQAPAAPAGAAAAEPPAPAGHIVKSPMVGTFYRSSTPGGAPLADVGQTVKTGMPVCIVEAMKIMNEIEADADGTIAKVLVDNGQAVEFGQPLFVIE